MIRNPLFRKNAVTWLLALAGISTLLIPVSAFAEQVIATDLIVQGSLCVGMDCVGGESFGFDTIRLKENNLRVKFDDTSVGNFPANDWQLTANESASGGANKFSIDDITGGRTPFTILAGAPTNSLFVNASGQVGLGSSTPTVHFHVFKGDSPTIRLEQNGSGGFTPQGWDIVGNEANFFVRDVTNGSKLPFRIRPGAPTSSIDISAAGLVGIGTPTPASRLHLIAPAVASGGESLARFDVTDDPVSRLEINNPTTTDAAFIPRLQGRSSSANAALIMEGLITDDQFTSPVIVFNAARIAGGAVATRPLVAFRNNNVVRAAIAANGDMTATSFNPTSTRTKKNNIVDLDSQKAHDAIRQLTPVEFVYKDDDTGEKRVGFIAEDVPEIVANADRNTVPIMDVVALVTRVVKDQQQTIDDQKKSIQQQQAAIEEQKATIGELARRLRALESQKQGQD